MLSRESRVFQSLIEKRTGELLTGDLLSFRAGNAWRRSTVRPIRNLAPATSSRGRGFEAYTTAGSPRRPSLSEAALGRDKEHVCTHEGAAAVPVGLIGMNGGLEIRKRQETPVEAEPAAVIEIRKESKLVVKSIFVQQGRHFRHDDWTASLDSQLRTAQYLSFVLLDVDLQETDVRQFLSVESRDLD